MEEQAGGGFSQGWGVSVRGVYFKPKMAAPFFFFIHLKVSESIYST